jgi:hypothetical protein
LKSASPYKKQFLLLWLLNPFISAIYLFRNMKWVPEIAPYLMLSFFFGFSFVLAPNSGADSTRYAYELELLNESQATFDTYFSQLYSEEGTKLDIYQPLLTWCVSKFTGNYQWLFGIYAMVFGYFWFKAIQLARSILPEKLNLFFVLLLIFFALINPIWPINGVRMWTAVGIFFYGLLQLHYLNSKKGYIFLVLTIFVHFSLTIALALYVLFRFFPAKNFRFLFVLYVLTFFIGELDLGAIRRYFELLPGFVQSRKSYLNEEFAEGLVESTEQLASHIRLYQNLLKYIIVFMVSWMYIMIFKIKGTAAVNRFNYFFSLALVFSIFSNLASQIPSGGRFVVLSNLLVIFCFIWFLSKEVKGYIPSSLKSFCLLVLAFIIIVQIRIGTDYFGAFLIIGNPIANLFIQDTTPFIDFVKALF